MVAVFLCLKRKIVSNKDAKVIGQRVKWIRNDKGLTQQAFADALGITANTVSKLEPGMRMPSLDLVADIAAYFKVNLNWLMMGIGEPYLND